jgi:hypothetical protein
LLQIRQFFGLDSHHFEQFFPGYNISFTFVANWAIFLLTVVPVVFYVAIGQNQRPLFGLGPIIEHHNSRKLLGNRSRIGHFGVVLNYQIEPVIFILEDHQANQRRGKNVAEKGPMEHRVLHEIGENEHYDREI